MAEIIKDKELITSLIEQVIEQEGTGDKIYNYYTNVCRLVPNNAIIVNDFTELFYPIYHKKVADNLNLHNKKCFISIPITGVEEQAKEDCKKIQKLFSEYLTDCEVFSPFEVAPDKNMPDSYYMGRDVEQLMNCDIMIQMNGWENSKGCRVENFIADTYGIEKISINSLFI